MSQGDFDDPTPEERETAEKRLRIGVAIVTLLAIVALVLILTR